VVVVTVIVVVVVVRFFHLVSVFFRSDRMLVRMFVPVRVMRIDPIGMMSVPPFAVVPFVTLVEVAVAFPISMIVGPFGMVSPHPAAIVLMPPVGFVPVVIGAVGAPSLGARQLSPRLGMVIHERLQIRMSFPPCPVVNQVGISRELLPQLGTFIDKVVKTLLVVILGRRNRRHRHREEHDRNSQHCSLMLHLDSLIPPGLDRFKIQQPICH